MRNLFDALPGFVLFGALIWVGSIRMAVASPDPSPREYNCSLFEEIEGLTPAGPWELHFYGADHARPLTGGRVNNRSWIAKVLLHQNGVVEMEVSGFYVNPEQKVKVVVPHYAQLSGKAKPGFEIHTIAKQGHPSFRLRCK